MLTPVDDVAVQGEKSDAQLNQYINICVRPRSQSWVCMLATHTKNKSRESDRSDQFLLDANLATSKFKGINYNTRRIRRISGS